jgi:hypothetical protein
MTIASHDSSASRSMQVHGRLCSSATKTSAAQTLIGPRMLVQTLDGHRARRKTAQPSASEAERERSTMSAPTKIHAVAVQIRAEPANA